MRQNLYSSSLVVSSRLPFSFQWCFILLALSILTATIPRADAATTNVVIDDTHGDQKTRNHIIYDPPASWIASSLSGSNTAFSANDKSEGAEVDLAQIFEKTWHEGVFTRNSSLSAVPGIPLLASATFFGTSVTVVCVNDTHDCDGGSTFFGTSVTVVCVIDTRYHTDLSFTLDRESIDKFYRPPTFSTSSVPLNSPFEYGVVVFKKDNLRQTNHTLTIQSGRTGGQLTPGSKLMLDYITYSFEDDSPDTAQGNTKDSTTRDSPLATSASGGNNAAQIAGGIIGAFLGLAFIGLVIIIYRRKQQNRPLLPTAMKQLFDGDKSPPKGEMNQGGHRGGGGTGGFNANLLVRARTLANRATSSIRSASGSGRRKRAEPLPRSHSRPQTTQVPGHGSVYPQHNFPTPGATPLLEDDMPLPPINTPLRGSLNSTRMESIQAWSRQTSLQAQDAVRSPRSLAGESEALESFYDDNATESRRIKTPPPTRKVFAVMNN